MLELNNFRMVDVMELVSKVSKVSIACSKVEKIETFEPIKCRFIKLKAISEINGLPWTSAAEIRVIQSGENITVKDYWRGNMGQTDWDATARHDSTKPDAIDVFVAALVANGGLWLRVPMPTL